MFVKSPANGGVFLAGQLVAQEMINLLTKIGVISNHRHSTNVQIASGTKISKRLKSLGVRSDTHRTKLMSYLSRNVSVLLDKAENALCEAPRLRFVRGRRFYDTVGGYDKIYTMKGAAL